MGESHFRLPFAQGNQCFPRMSITLLTTLTLLLPVSQLIMPAQSAHLAHHNIQHYETLAYNPLIIPETSPESLERRKRSVESSSKPSSSTPLRVAFFAFSKPFVLHLVPDTEVLSPEATLELTDGGVQDLHQWVQPYRGTLQDHPQSQVFGHMVQGVFRGTISPFGAHSVHGSYHVEPAHHFPALYDTITHPQSALREVHSIIYHDSHVTLPSHHLNHSHSGRVRRDASASDNIASHFCGWSNPQVRQTMEQIQKPMATRFRRAAAIDDIPRRYQYSYHQFNDHGDAIFSPQSGTQRNHSGFGDLSSSSTSGEGSRPGFASSYNNRVCNLFLQSDTFLWDYVMAMPSVKRDPELAVKEITTIFILHVQAAMAIFQRTDFTTFDGTPSYNGVSFRVDRVRINQTGVDCPPAEYGAALYQQQQQTQGNSFTLYEVNGPNNKRLPHQTQPPPFSGPQRERWLQNPFCMSNIDVTNFLNLNSYQDHSMFCLAYVFTYRDFSGGTLGLAWVAEPGGSGGVCEWYRPMREGTHNNVHKSLNTGIVTLLNYGSRVASKVSQLTFAHEMGHNFGSKHDDDHKGVQGGACLPPENSPQGNYIMFASATSGDKENNNKFSVCSRDSIARLMSLVLQRRSHSCFKTKDGAFCGNKLTEPGEECDCGYDSEDCQDHCCHPRLLFNSNEMSPQACKLKSEVALKGANGQEKRVSVRCSPTAGECCTHECQIRNSTTLCRSHSDCYEAAYCDGVNATCPPSKLHSDRTPCQDHTRVCKGGECIGSICELMDGWKECSLPRSEKVTPEMMCFVACQANISDATTCISTYELERDPPLRARYPEFAKLLAKNNNRGIQFKAGAPCDSYRGYCDVFHRCRSVDAEGPLARLRNLIFNPQLLQKMHDWILAHWWAIILMALGMVIFLVLFVKICSVHTPSSNPHLPPARQFTLRRGRPTTAGGSGHAPSAHSGRRAPTTSATGANAGGNSSRSGQITGPTPAPRNRRHAKGPSRSMLVSEATIMPLAGAGAGPSSSSSSRPPSQVVSTGNVMWFPVQNSASSSAYHTEAPPPYTAVIELTEPPRQHGKGGDKTGHKEALNQMAARFSTTHA